MEALLQECQNLSLKLYGGAVATDMQPRTTFESFTKEPYEHDFVMKPQDLPYDDSVMKPQDLQKQFEFEVEIDELEDAMKEMEETQAQLDELNVETFEQVLASDEQWVSSGVRMIHEQNQEIMESTNNSYRAQIDKPWMINKSKIRIPMPVFNDCLAWMTQFRMWYTKGDWRSLPEEKQQQIYKQASKIIRDMPFLSNMPMNMEWLQFASLFPGIYVDGGEKHKDKEENNIVAPVSKSSHRLNLSGGTFINKGSYKCVTDHEHAISCTDGTQLKAGPNQVKIVLSKKEYDSEVAAGELIVQRMSREIASQVSVIMTKDTPHCTTPFFPDINQHGHTYHNCGFNSDDFLEQTPGSDSDHSNKKTMPLVLVIMPRVEKFPHYSDKFESYDAYHKFQHQYIINLGKVLMTFAQHKIVHGDVKMDNVIFDQGQPKMIDFGFTLPYSAFKTAKHEIEDFETNPEKFSDSDKLIILNKLKMYKNIPYPAWPSNISQYLNNNHQYISPETHNYICESIDKHGFMFTVWQITSGQITTTSREYKLFYDMSEDGKITEFTPHFQSEEHRDFASIWDPYHDRKFLSWNAILTNLANKYEVAYTPHIDMKGGGEKHEDEEENHIVAPVSKSSHRLNLSGGTFINKGSYKCVTDHEHAISCTDGTQLKASPNLFQNILNI